MTSPAEAGRHVLMLTAAFLSAAAGAVFAQATFTAGTRTVAIFATVTGADGRLAPDLEKGDFAVDDNGKPQPITLFANEIQPITVVLLLDRSGSMRANFSLVEKAAEQFVDVLGPADKARIGSFSNRIEVDPAGRFTSSHDELLTILRNELQEEGPTPLWNAVNVGITALLHQDGRRVILVFTDGMDSPGNGGQNNSSLSDVMKRAEEENVMVYAVGLAGSNGFTAGGSGRGSFGGRGGGPAGGRSGRAGRGGGGGDKPDPGLPKIAAATGGGYFELTTASDLAATFTRVAEELHHQYALGFTPTQLDGKMHTLLVRVTREGAVVRARRSYLAAKS
jgi:Ca-activated chloride channel family protein